MRSALPLFESERPAGDARTHCPFCAFQCGMTMSAAGSSEAGEVVIRGDESFPVNRGQMCVKGFSSGALLRHPSRLTTPLIRDAGGELREASWGEALDYVAERLTRLDAQHGASSIGVFGSGALTNEKAYWLGKFARVALGTPNIDYNGRYCMASAAAGQNASFGIDRGLPFPVSDIGETEALMLWGSNCAETLPPIMQWVNEQKQRGGKLIVVDPRRTDTARVADLHLQLTPGSDLALANGLLYLAVEEGLIDQEYVRERTVGFDVVRRSVLGYHPAHVERLTGVSSERMRAAVRLMGRSASSMLLSGRGPEQQSKGSDTVIALINLMLALGKVGKPMSGYGCLTGQGNGQGGREHGQKADQLPGYRLIENDAHRAEIAAAWGIDVDTLPHKGKSAYELFDSLGPAGGVRALLVFGSNVVVASPNASNVAKKLEQLELLVVCDSFENETSRFAHVILPVYQWAEEDGTMTNLEGRVILRRRAVRAPTGVRSDLYVIRELAERLGAAEHFQCRTTEAVFEDLCRVTRGGRADYSGITYAKIEEQNGVFWPCPSAEHAGTPHMFRERFAFADGKARFWAVEHRAAGELPDREYPFFFTTGRYKEHYNSGAQTRQIDALVSAKPEPRLQMHPTVASRLGVVDRARVLVESRRGSVEFRVLVSGDVRPDTLFAPFHWGGRQAANVLTNPALDPKSRMPEFKVCAVRASVVPEDDVGVGA